MRRRDGSPLWLDERTTGAHPLRRAELRAQPAEEGYDEAWLQHLLYRHPTVLPIEQIETGFGQLIPLCRELPVTFGGGRSGALDVLFVTAEGGLVLVEAKLWRNPEARRSAVAQAMEYAAALFRLSYEGLQNAVLRARAADAERSASIYEIVTQQAAGTDEVEFVDAVSRNLKRGRAIVAVVGDGIREDLVPLAELLQSHAGLRFTFALIELAIYETPQAGVRLVTPSVLAQTALIERGVVQIEDGTGGVGSIVIRDPAVTPSSTSSGRAFGIGEDQFFDLLRQMDPGLPVLLKSFLAKLEERGVYADFQGGLNLKHAAPSGKALNVGTIDKSGYLETSPATWWDRTAIGRTYNQGLAALIGGFVREMNNGEVSAVRTATKRTPRISDFLPMHEEAWLAAIDRYIREAFEAAKEV